MQIAILIGCLPMRQNETKMKPIYNVLCLNLVLRQEHLFIYLICHTDGSRSDRSKQSKWWPQIPTIQNINLIDDLHILMIVSYSYHLDYMANWEKNYNIYFLQVPHKQNNKNIDPLPLCTKTINASIIYKIV